MECTIVRILLNERCDEALIMQRRSFLLTLGSLALGSGLTSCQAQTQQILRLLALKSSLPSQLPGEFSQSIKPIDSVVELASEGQFTEILDQLREWLKTGRAEAKGFKIPLIPPAKSAAYIPNLVSMSDAWLPMAIQEKLIQPIEVNNLKNWSKLESRWRELAQRDDRGNSIATGQIWGVPYRWGMTVIIYRRDRLTDANIPIPQDWVDLWNPKLKQRISLLDRSREVIGLTLKKLGYSYNQANLSQIANLKSELAKIHQQAKFYSAEDYLQPLLMGDTWVAVGWSSDAIDLIQKNPNICAIVPKSGTAISADLWVQPASPKSQVNPDPDRIKLAQQWIDYCLQPKVSNQISLFTSATAPLLTTMSSTEILPDILKNPLLVPAKSILANNEFIYPLSSASNGDYNRLWQEIRRAKVDLS
jgi:putative spermidine/putrescine transport system substrate-binding protein